MLNFVTEQWNAGFGGKVYIVLLFYLIISTCFHVWNYFTQGSQRRMKFLMEAQKAGRFVPGVISCFTIEGSILKPCYKAEYMYVVNNKRYFVTYQFDLNNELDPSKDKFEADSMLSDIKKYIILFYDEKKPQKVVCKPEIFVTSFAMNQIPTDKNNRYRDVKKDWHEAIDLRV